MGEESAALEALGLPAGESGRELRGAILAERGTLLELTASRWTDVDDQELETIGLRAERGRGGGRRLHAELLRFRADEPGTPAIVGTRAAVGLDWRFDRTWSLQLRAGGADVGGNLDRDEVVDVGAGETRDGEEIDARYALGDAWLTWTPADRLRMDASASRGLLDTPRALARGIRLDLFGLGLDRALADRAVVRASATFGRYTDDNERTSVAGELEVGPFRAAPAVRTWAGAGGHVTNFDRTPDHGYYSPDRYDAIHVAGRAEIRLGERASLAGDARLASERENDEDRFGVLSGGGELRVGLGGGVGISVFARRSTSRFDTGAGYEREGFGVSVFKAP